MSKPNERSCQIFLEKLLVFSPPPVTPFFLWQKCFFRIFRKNVEFFFNEIDCKKFSKIFENFQLKKNRNFLLLNSLKKNCENFFTVNFIEKTIRYFFRKFEKKHFCHKTKGNHFKNFGVFYLFSLLGDLPDNNACPLGGGSLLYLFH